MDDHPLHVIPSLIPSYAMWIRSRVNRDMAMAYSLISYCGLLDNMEMQKSSVGYTLSLSFITFFLTFLFPLLRWKFLHIDETFTKSWNRMKSQLVTGGFSVR
jgi:hypothetical protein